MVAGGYSEPKQGIVTVRLDLRRQHARGRTPRLARFPTGVEHSNPPPPDGQLPGAGGSDGASSDHDHVVAGGHDSDETI